MREHLWGAGGVGSGETFDCVWISKVVFHLVTGNAPPTRPRTSNGARRTALRRRPSARAQRARVHPWQPSLPAARHHTRVYTQMGREAMFADLAVKAGGGQCRRDVGVKDVIRAKDKIQVQGGGARHRAACI